MTQQNYQSYQVWDVPTRFFHWLNVLCVVGLIAVGTAILWARAGNSCPVIQRTNNKV